MDFYRRTINNRLRLLNKTEDEVKKEAGIDSFTELTVDQIVRLSDVLGLSRNIILEGCVGRSMFTTEDMLNEYIDNDNLDAIKDLYVNNYLFNRSDELYLVKQLEIMKYPSTLKRSAVSQETFTKLAKYLFKKDEIPMLINLSSVHYRLPLTDDLDKDKYFEYLISAYDVKIDIFKHQFADALYETLSSEDKLHFEELYVKLMERDEAEILESVNKHEDVMNNLAITAIPLDKEENVYTIFFKNDIHEKFSEANKNRVSEIYKEIDEACKGVK